MKHDKEIALDVPGRYMSRKKDLEELLKARTKLSKELSELAQPGSFSSIMGGIIRLNVIRAQDIVTSLSEIETMLEDLVAEINKYAEKIGMVPIKIASGTPR